MGRTLHTCWGMCVGDRQMLGCVCRRSDSRIEEGRGGDGGRENKKDKNDRQGDKA